MDYIANRAPRTLLILNLHNESQLLPAMFTPIALPISPAYGFILVGPHLQHHSIRLHRLDPGSACQNPLPKLYATTQQAAANPAIFTYNCTQHAHANYVQNLLPATDSMLVVRLSYPRPHRGPWARLAWLASGLLLPLYVRAERHGRARQAADRTCSRVLA